MFKEKNLSGYCRLLLPYHEVECHFFYMCDYCDVCHRIRQIKACEELNDSLLFDWHDVLPMTPKGGGSDFYKRPVILKPESMRRVGMKVNLINQLFYADGGSGCFKHNPSGMVDGYILLNAADRYTFFRNDFYGVPNESAVKRFKSLYGKNIKI